MEGECGVTRIKIDELHSLDIKEDQIEGENAFTRSIIEEISFSDI